MLSPKKLNRVPQRPGFCPGFPSLWPFPQLRCATWKHGAIPDVQNHFYGGLLELLPSSCHCSTVVLARVLLLWCHEFSSWIHGGLFGRNRKSALISLISDEARCSVAMLPLHWPTQTLWSLPEHPTSIKLVLAGVAVLVVVVLHAAQSLYSKQGLGEPFSDE